MALQVGGTTVIRQQQGLVKCDGIKDSEQHFYSR